VITRRSSAPPTTPPSPADARAIWTTRAPGTYLLLLRLDEATELEVGRLGRVAFPTGWYVYVGSALGGLGARLRRHARLAKRYHWHVDTLRAASALVAVAVRPGADRVECAVVATVAGLAGGARPAPRFGSSDCRCRSHLVHFASQPDLRLDQAWLVVPMDGGASG
jgi:Uri superfamily endonuclease